jgi:hypothetical protein
MTLFSRLARWFEAPAVVEMTATPIEWPKAPAPALFPVTPDLTARAVAERTAPLRRPKFQPGNKLVVAIPYCAGDLGQVCNLLRWMSEIGGAKGYTVLLCAPAGLEDAEADHVHALAEDVFSSVQTIRTSFDLPKEGWPIGTCWSFLHIARHCNAAQWDFLIVEPDCVPLRSGWMREIEEEYRDCGLPYMGKIEPAAQGYPAHVAGNAVYHWGVFDQFPVGHLDQAWDIGLASHMVPLAHHTDLIAQEWGKPGQPPVFTSVQDLERIPKQAVLFHRSKDGKVIELLRKRMQWEEGRESPDLL